MSEKMEVFAEGGVNREVVRIRLNTLVASANHEAAAYLMQAANGWDMLCAGVNRSIGNAFKEEGEEIFAGVPTVEEMQKWREDSPHTASCECDRCYRGSGDAKKE